MIGGGVPGGTAVISTLPTADDVAQSPTIQRCDAS